LGDLVIHHRGAPVPSPGATGQAENEKKRDIFLSADPRGIGAAFHPDETDERFHPDGITTKT